MLNKKLDRFAIRIENQNLLINISSNLNCTERYSFSEAVSEGGKTFQILHKLKKSKFAL